MLKIHPDKHVGGDWLVHHRATEMFKAITDVFNKHKKAVGR